MVEKILLVELLAAEPAGVEEGGGEVDVLDVLHQVPLLGADLVAEHAAVGRRDGVEGNVLLEIARAAG